MNTLEAIWQRITEQPVVRHRSTREAQVPLCRAVTGEADSAGPLASGPRSRTVRHHGDELLPPWRGERRACGNRLPRGRVFPRSEHWASERTEDGFVPNARGDRAFKLRSNDMSVTTESA
jgi:hypothetical protein